MENSLLLIYNTYIIEFVEIKRDKGVQVVEIALIVLGAIIVYSVFTYFWQRNIVKTLTQEEFRAGYRKAQLIDVREPEEYAAGHILGARNIPLTQLRMRMKELRPDQPIYLYCQSGLRSGRAAQMLYRKGYRDLYHLKGGFKQWTGKVKKKS
jgi:rhodanese-related sulfurtransferase